MKLKNITESVREVSDNGQLIKFGPGEIIEIEKATFNENAFEIIYNQKSKDKKTLDFVEKDKLKKEIK